MNAAALLLLPIALPAVAGLLMAALPGRARLHQGLALGVAAGLCVAAAALVVATVDGAVLVLRLGGWHPHVGIAWAADGLAAIMLALAAVSALAATLSLPGSLGLEEERWLRPLLMALLAGVNASFLTADLFNLFVCFELMLLASFALIALGGGRERLRGALPYVLINVVASGLFLAGVGAVYGTIGTVNLAELSARVADGAPPAFWAAMALVLAVFAIKAALAPVFTWLPDSYPGAGIAVSALFAGLLTKVGVYALLRVVPLVGGDGVIQAVLLPIAAATMLLGVLGAFGRDTIRGILSFHVVSQVGYMVFGLALATPFALAAAIVYVIHHIVVKTALFLAGGVFERQAGTGALKAMAGLAHGRPWLAAAFFIAAMALAGMPPFSGFWGKLFLIMAGLEARAWVATGIAVAVGLLTLGSMLKIWAGIAWHEREGEAPAPRADRGMVAGAMLLVALSIAIGLAASPLLAHARRVADQLATGDAYRTAILGETRR